MAESGWEDMRHRNREGDMVAAMAGVEKLVGVHRKTPTGHATTWGRYREREWSTANSPRKLSSTVRHRRARVTAVQMAMMALGFCSGGVA